MRHLRALITRLIELFRKPRRERELAAELESHLQMHIDDNLRSGMTPQESRRQALLKLGGMEQTKEAYRERKGLPIIESVLRDLRFGLRTLRKNLGFTTVAVLTLAIGIGSNTAIFSVLESQLWRPLPFPESERLVDAHVVHREKPRQWDVLSNSIYKAWRERSHSLTNLGAYHYPANRNLTAGGTSERVQVMPITSSLLDALEVPLETGRGFLPEEETPGRDRVAILTHALWQTRFASDNSVIGKPVVLDGQPYIVIGIASPRLHFEYIDEPAIFVPLATEQSEQALRNTYVIGRLAPGVTPEQARAELAGILETIPKSSGGQAEYTASVTNLRETWTGFAAGSLFFFAGAVLLVLLIACVNNAGLLLARGLARQREFTLRAALGAGRGTLIRQSLVESLILSLAAGAAGTLIGLWGAAAFAAYIPQDTLPRNTHIALDARVLLFVLAVSIFSALLTGVVPALLSSRVDLHNALRQGASGLSSGRSQNRARGALVIIEVALALVLLFGAGLFLSSFVRLEQAPRGFDAPGALSFRVSLRGESYTQPEQQQRYFRNLADQLGALPGVEAVTVGTGIPLDGYTLSASVNVAGRPPRRKHGTGVVTYAVASNFFGLLHMHLLAGRTFAPQDSGTSPRVAIINRNARHTLFGSEDPLGKILEFVPDERRSVSAEAPVQIVGVSENAQVFGANEVPFDVIYFPFCQQPAPAADIVISSSLPGGALLGAIRETAYSLDKDQPIFDVQTMDDLVSTSLRRARFDLMLVASLAIVALTLVSAGIFGTVAYFVQQRTREFGIRLALGATPDRILRHALSRAFVMGFVGLLFGVVVSLALGRVLRGVLYLVPGEHTGMLYGVRIYDPLSMSIACILLFAVLTLASYIPAVRAARIEPTVALRYE
jgi:putative ABC transport system permease protein